MENAMNPEKCKIYGYVRANKAGSFIRNAEVRVVQVVQQDKAAHDTRTTESIATGRTNAEGRYAVEFTPEDGLTYRVECSAFGHIQPVEITKPMKGETLNRDLVFDKLVFTITLKSYDEQGKPAAFHSGKAGRSFLATLELDEKNTKIKDCHWSASHGALVTVQKARLEVDINPQQGGELNIRATIFDAADASLQIEHVEFFAQADVQMVGGKVNLRLERTATTPTLDEAFWTAIRDRTDAISFGPYSEFIDHVMKGDYEFHTKFGNDDLDRKLNKVGTVRHGVQAYELLKVATQVFLLLQCGVKIGGDRDDGRIQFDSIAFKLDEYLGHSGQLPYIRRVIDTAFPWLKREGLRCDCVLAAAHEPCLIELIKEYFLEEGMLMQTMNAITMRFQNVHAPGERDPLAHLEIDPLRPLGNILWGRTQDLHLLSVKRRAYEYMHQYGLALYGKATASLRPADNRSKFLEGFHNLLYLCSVFFKEDNDTTVIADGYPLLNALKEVHLVLAQGAHNQFGDLPWTARAETLVQEWIMAQPEIREFLQSRAMVPYKEPWMPQVDTMKTLQGWSDVTVTSFRDLGVYGERIVLSVRFGNWIAYVDENHAKNWARFFRADIQAYLHAYRAVTGVDLTNPDTVDATMPSVLLQKRLSVQHGAR